MKRVTSLFVEALIGALCVANQEPRPVPHERTEINRKLGMVRRVYCCDLFDCPNVETLEPRQEPTTQPKHSHWFDAAGNLYAPHAPEAIEIRCFGDSCWMCAEEDKLTGMSGAYVCPPEERRA